MMFHEGLKPFHVFQTKALKSQTEMCLWFVKCSLVTLPHLFEVLEGELVHWIDLRETGDNKVQD